MIKIARINAIVLRHLIPTFRDPIRITDMLYYPFIDIMLFGFLSVWAQEDAVQSTSFVKAILTSVACWYIVYRTSVEMVRNLLMEIWDNHIINLFATPITIVELLMALMILGLIQASITFIYSIAIIWLIFSQNIFLMLPSLLPFIPAFILSGWTLGLIISALILYFGKSAEALCWAIPWFAAMTSGAWFPLKLFPYWAKKIALSFPLAHQFEGVRALILNNTLSYYHLLIAVVLSIFYIVLAFALVLYAFSKSKNKGLTRLE